MRNATAADVANMASVLNDAVMANQSTPLFGVVGLLEDAGMAAEDALMAAEDAGKVTWGMWRDLKTVALDGRQYAEVNGRYFTREAIDRMTPTNYGTAAGGYSARGIPLSVVQDVIQNGETSEVTVRGEVRTIYDLNGVRVVTARGGRIVITVYPTGGK